ncbi:unannotated protein [freshwater metagenome]|uniref:Unannotated protein n=1 Tax=freshwater metagenome TaxID=449393 RepID=A0A6J6MRD2_9ZZZZ
MNKYIARRVGSPKADVIADTVAVKSPLLSSLVALGGLIATTDILPMLVVLIINTYSSN